MPRDGFAEGRYDVGADGVEALAHQGCVLAKGIVVGGVEGTVNLGCSTWAGAGDFAIWGVEADGEGRALLQGL